MGKDLTISAFLVLGGIRLADLVLDIPGKIEDAQQWNSWVGGVVMIPDLLFFIAVIVFGVMALTSGWWEPILKRLLGKTPVRTFDPDSAPQVDAMPMNAKVSRQFRLRSSRRRQR